MPGRRYTLTPHPEELAKQASRRMGNTGTRGHPSRRAQERAPQDEVVIPFSQPRLHPVKDTDNLTIERPTFVTHLECAMEGDHYPAAQIHNLSKAGKPLLVRYDLAGVKKALTK